MAEIAERREVRVTQGDSTFVFVADPDAGRLAIHEEDPDGRDDEVCSLTIADRDELTGFLEGLRRVLGVQDGRGEAGDRGSRGAAPALDTTPRSAPATKRGADDDRDGEDRDAAISRARERNPNAFKAWTAAEEKALLEAHRSGTSLRDLARSHERSQRAVAMRLQRLGEDVSPPS